MNKKSSGRDNFISRAGLNTSEFSDGCRQVLEKISEHKLQIIRLSFVDQHGILRGKSYPARDIEMLFQSGCAMTSSLLLKDTSHRTVFPIWSNKSILGLDELSGAGDIMMVPDPGTFRILPWVKGTGWMICDLFDISANPLIFSSRGLAQRSMAMLRDAGFEYVSGLEVEFHIFKLDDAKLQPHNSGHPAAPPEVSLLTHGYQYLTESRADEMEPVTELLRSNIEQLGLAIRSIEVEFGPSQVEFTFHPEKGIQSADNMVLFRSAVKQICHRHGYHASFMCRPQIDNLFSCGWHLHQSILNLHDGENAFMPKDSNQLLSPTGQQFAAGLLKHAPACCVFTTPTINGYKRYQPYGLAPDRISWARDNKASMLRVISAPGDSGSRIENRVGEPAANPYLYLASQCFSGLSGITELAIPPPTCDQPYGSEETQLPSNLMQAVDALNDDPTMTDLFGRDFVQWISTIKTAEFNRFMSAVTDWEQREYFSNF
ncbi:MAG: glutamine synthetase [Gammaproteobacteria bacterium]